MKPRMRPICVSCISSCIAAVLLLAPSFAGAQEKAVPATLRQNSNRSIPSDTVIQGSVVSFTENSTVAPLGAHVVVQTSSGTVDVHLGNAALLKQNNISLKAGDSVRIAGSSVPYAGSNIFAARLLQKGSQSVALRSASGIPLGSPANRAAMHASGTQSQGGVR